MLPSPLTSTSWNIEFHNSSSFYSAVSNICLSSYLDIEPLPSASNMLKANERFCSERMSSLSAAAVKNSV